MNALYNDIEPFACDWLEQLIARGHIALGRVERRSISELTAADVAGSGQRHFFAGIGVWSAALRLAGVPDNADVWTGSCPCQPFSAAGSRSGTSDPRHLWPAWFALIEQCRPAIIFGEQVASVDGLHWLDLVFADLERCGYTVGAADLCAAGVGAPHIRQRLFFVAYTDDCDIGQRLHVRPRQPRQEVPDAHGRRSAGNMAVADGARQQSGHTGRRAIDAQRGRDVAGRDERVIGLGDSPGSRHDRAEDPREDRRDACAGSRRVESERTSAAGWLGDSGRDGNLQHDGELRRDEGEREVWSSDSDHASVTAGATRGFWAGAEWIECTDGKARPVEPGTFPLAHGAPARVGRLRGYGNAIVRQVAATFIRASLEAIGDMSR